ASYWLKDSELELGAHLWYGSGHNTLLVDDSLGPIDIDKDSNPATGDAIGVNSAEDKLAIAESNYKLTDTGIGLGAGYTGMAGMRFDFGLDYNSLGVTWEPNGISDYVDAGGSGFAINARAHYNVNDK